MHMTSTWKNMLGIFFLHRIKTCKHRKGKGRKESKILTKLFGICSGNMHSKQSQPNAERFFFLCGSSFTNIHESQDCRGRGGHFINSSLPPASQTLRH